MKFTIPFRTHLPARAVRIGSAVGVILGAVALLLWGAWFLRREASRLTMPIEHGVEIPVLNRALLSELAARVPK